jgi:ubiquinone/menaquinone biosynthesis C-methylase UbiE
MSIEIADHQEKFGQIFESFHFWPRILAGQTVVDLGCGGGSLTRKLAASFPGAQFIGLDLRPEIIEAAKQRAAQSKLLNTDFRTTNACSTEGLDVANVDGIFCRFLMEDLPDASQALRNMHSSLKSGGWACSTERLNSFYKVYPPSSAIESAWTSIYKHFETEFGAKPNITKELPTLFEQAGFKNVKVQGHSSVISSTTPGDVYEWYVTMALDLVEGSIEMLSKEGLETEATLKRAVADYRELLASPYSFILETAICVSGTK